jgi:hypothetical protein
VAQVEQVPRRRRVRRGNLTAEPCACTADRMCLYYYAELDPTRQARVRRAAGVWGPNGR